MTVEADIDSIRHKTSGKILSVTNVKHRRVFFIGCGLKRRWRQGLGTPLHDLVNCVVPHFVEQRIFREILRGRGQAGGHVFDKGVFALGPQGIVEPFLVVEGIGGFFAHILATGRPGSVARIDDDIIGQGHDFLV